MAFGGSGRCSTVDFAVVMVRVPKIDIATVHHHSATIWPYRAATSPRLFDQLSSVSGTGSIIPMGSLSFSSLVRAVRALRASLFCDVVRVSSEIRTALFFGGWSASIAAFKPVSAIMGLATKQ